MVSFTPKDADEVVNYRLPWEGQLAAGDTVATSQWVPTGAIVTAQAIEAGGLATTVRVSGGTNGETATLLNTVTTTNGETLEQYVTLAIVSSAEGPLTGYAFPTVRHLLARYPAFATVPYDTVAVHLTDAGAMVDTSWLEADYPVAIMAHAAHTMALLGLGAEDETAKYARAGVSSLRDGAFSVSFSDKRTADASGGGFKATPYGQIYATLLRRNKGGPRLAGGGEPAGGWGFVAQQNNGGILPWSGF